MKIRILFLTVIFSLTILSCKAPAINRFSESIENSKSVEINSMDFLDSERIEINKGIKRRLEEPNKILSYNDSITDKKITSYYNNYSVEFKEKGLYFIDVESLCSCIGFNKFLFVPSININNPNAQAEFLRTKMLEPTGKYPARLNRMWQIKIEKPSIINFSIYSDNSSLDEVLEKSSSMEPYVGNGYVGSVYVETEIKAGFKGKYLLEVRGL